MARRKKVNEKSETQKLADAYWSCFTTPAGAMVLADLKAKVQDRTVIPTHYTNDVPVNAVLVNEGGRRLYLYVISMMEEARKDYGGGTADPGTAANGSTVITAEPDYEPGDDIE